MPSTTPNPNLLLHITLSHKKELLDLQSFVPLDQVHIVRDKKNRIVQFDDIYFVYRGRGRRLLAIGGLRLSYNIQGKDSRISFSIIKQDKKRWWHSHTTDTPITPPSIRATVSNRSTLLSLDYLGLDEPSITHYQQRGTIAKINDITLQYGSAKDSILSIGNYRFIVTYGRFLLVQNHDERVAITLVDHKKWRR